MDNSTITAERWTKFVAARVEFAAGERLLDAFKSSKITKLCQCGCNSFNLEALSVERVVLGQPSERGRLAYASEFSTQNPEGTLEFLIFLDASGHFAGMDVQFNGNAEPIPLSFDIVEPPFHVYGELASPA